MDIVSRLKSFISHLNIPVTQFADSCNIPRPTLSQLLNGRNKKVSDELIGKIHDSYPNLSVLWLMFGEGDMLHDGNIEISEPKTDSIFDFDSSERVDNKTNSPSFDFESSFTDFESENVDRAIGDEQPRLSFDNTSDKSTTLQRPEKNTISFSPDNSKRIVNIIIYYSDNSFESFVPAPAK